MSQIVISSWGGIRKLPYVFTEQGVSMLSSDLNSERAIQVNIQIMRIFSRFRQMLSTNDELKKKIETMEKKYDNQFKIVFDVTCMEALMPRCQGWQKAAHQGINF